MSKRKKISEEENKEQERKNKKKEIKLEFIEREKNLQRRKRKT